MSRRRLKPCADCNNTTTRNAKSMEIEDKDITDKTLCQGLNNGFLTVKMEPGFDTKLQHETESVEYILCEPAIKMEPETAPSGSEIDTVDWRIKTEDVDTNYYEFKAESDVKASSSRAYGRLTVKQFTPTQEDCGERNSLSSAPDLNNGVPFVTIFPNLFKKFMMADRTRLNKPWADTESVKHVNSVTLAKTEEQSVAKSPSSTAASFDCDFCRAKYPTKTSLTEHVTSFCFKNLFPSSAAVKSRAAKSELATSSIKVFSCSCKKKFNDISDLEQHVRNNLKKGCFVIRCRFCLKLYCNVSTLNRHLLIHTGEKKHECKFCHRLFSQIGNRNRHERKHIGDKKYECKFCLKVFSLCSDRNKHLKTHGKEEKFACTFCQKLFTQTGNRNKHLLTHIGEKKYQCKFCPMLFRQSSSRTHHLLTAHKYRNLNCVAAAWTEPVNIVSNEKQLNAESFECSSCRTKFATKSSLTKHVTGFCFKNLFPSRTAGESLAASSEHVTLSGETYSCLCKMRFKDIFELEHHVLHSPKKGCSMHGIKCRFCPKLFDDPSTLNEHLRTHTWEKKYECKFCRKLFSQSGNRNVHELTHTGEKRHACTFCPRLFTQSGNRNAHMRRHKGR